MSQSSIFPIYIRSEYRSDGQAFQRFQSEAQRAAQAAKREFQGVEAALNQALSRPRTQSGSLDLGLDELRRAAVAQQQVAIAAREVAEATKRAATANGQFNASLSGATRAAFELANAEERATREMLQQITALETVQRELSGVASKTSLVTQANRMATNSAGATRTAFLQLGQQMQDAAIQAQMGASAFLIFGQQAPQAAFALSGLADSSNRTQAAIGRIATFMSGPFGAAIFVGVAALGPLIAKLFEAETAADEVRFSTDALGNAQSILGSTIDIVTGKINTQSEALRNLAAAQILANQIESAKKQADLRTQLAETARERGELIRGPLGLPLPSVRPGGGLGTLEGFARRPSQSAEIVRSFLDGKTGAGQAIDQLRQLERAGQITQDRLLDLSSTIANLGVEQRNSEIFAAADRLLRGNATDADRGLLLKPDRQTARRTRPDASAAKASREAERLATFGENAAETVQRINERFSEQPRLITQAAQATRQLDEIIKDLAERKPVGFEKLIEQAATAKRTVEEALLRPFELLRAESEQRLQIETLLAQGREDEARALQEVLRVEQQIGTLTSDQRAEIEGIVRAEQERTRYLRDQQALFLAQLDVVQTVRRDLTDLLSGRSTDFFGNFRQAIQDLQGQRLFEDLFGDSFRAIEEQLRGNTPQGRANARFAAEVERTATTTARVEQVLGGLADSIETASARLRSGVPANDNPGGFNPRVAMAMAGLQAAGIGLGITVTGNREATIARRSVRDIAQEISQAAVKPGVEMLSRLIGMELAGVVGDIASGVIAGKVTGGTVGAIAGGLEGLTKNIAGLEKVTEKLGQIGKGAQTGQTVAGIANLIGLPSNSTGAQIGGSIGQLTGIPGADIIGAIAGNFLGALIAGIPKGSATIGGAGGSLGVTSVTGNRSALRQVAGELGGSVVETINQVARQLGATVDASRGSVSIGQRDGDFRVDTSGRGTTRVAGGAVDFGKDAEAAIRFAVQDLIQDGVIAGLKASEARLLQAGKDIESAVRDVLEFRSVFDRLREIRDPIGFAVDQVGKEFDRLRDLFRRAGADAAEFAELEELAGIERARAIEDVTRRVVGSLRSLLDDLRFGNNGLALRTRQQNALGQFNQLAARVQAGDSSAFDDFADISKQLLDIERQLFGSTQSYFDRLAQITALTEKAVADQTNVAMIGRGGEVPAIDRSIDVMNGNLGSKLDRVASGIDRLNENLIATADPLRRGGGSFEGGSGGGLSPFPSLVANF